MRAKLQHGRSLSDDEIRVLLSYTRSRSKKGKAYIIDADGNKHYFKTRHLPSWVVGSFAGKDGESRKYNPGHPKVVMYKEGSDE